VTLTYDSAIEFVAVINNDVYMKLSDKNKAIVDEAAKMVEQKLRDAVYDNEKAVIEEVKSKMKVVTLNDAQRGEWSKALKGVEDRFVKETGDLGASALAAVKGAM